VQETGWLEPVAPGAKAAGDARWSAVDEALANWEPMLTDEVGDAVGGDAAYDIHTVVLAATQDDVLVRFKMGGIMPPDNVRDMRFWLEQEGRFLTVETKSKSADARCTLVESGKAEQAHVEECFRRSDATVDIAIPRAKVPKVIDLAGDFWISGPQVCCVDDARTEPIDRLDASQVVWRVPYTGPTSKEALPPATATTVDTPGGPAIPTRTPPPTAAGAEAPAG